MINKPNACPAKMRCNEPGPIYMAEAPSQIWKEGSQVKPKTSIRYKLPKRILIGKGQYKEAGIKPAVNAMYGDKKLKDLARLPSDRDARRFKTKAMAMATPEKTRNRASWPESELKLTKNQGKVA